MDRVTTSKSLIPNGRESPHTSSVDPLISGCHRVGDHDAFDAQIVCRNRVRDGVALAFDDQAGTSQCLLDRIHAHLDSGKHTRQFPRNRRLAHAREAAQDDPHALTVRFHRATV